MHKIYVKQKSFLMSIVYTPGISANHLLHKFNLLRPSQTAIGIFLSRYNYPIMFKSAFT